jgi:hypothetical protein
LNLSPARNGAQASPSRTQSLKIGGYVGSAFAPVWSGLVDDAALIPAFAAICTLLWNKGRRVAGITSHYTQNPTCGYLAIAK